MSEIIKILEMIENGEISSAEGEKLLAKVKSLAEDGEASPTLLALARLEEGESTLEEALEELSQSPQAVDAEQEIEVSFPPASSRPSISEEEIARWKNWWTIPFYIGIGFVILSAFWINSAYESSGYGFWFFCSWLPMLLGILLVTLTLGGRSAPWIHIRVKGPKERVAISIPIPFGLTSWALNTFGHYVPNLDRASIDEILRALEQTKDTDTPFYVQVDEEDGEQVEVYIG